MCQKTAKPVCLSLEVKTAPNGSEGRFGGSANGNAVFLDFSTFSNISWALIDLWNIGKLSVVIFMSQQFPKPLLLSLEGPPWVQKRPLTAQEAILEGPPIKMLYFSVFRFFWHFLGHNEFLKHLQALRHSFCVSTDPKNRFSCLWKCPMGPKTAPNAPGGHFGGSGNKNAVFLDLFKFSGISWAIMSF